MRTRSRPRPSFSSSILSASLALTISALAHDSPEHKVQDLSFEIARSGRSPALLMERAIEHRALGQLADAAADFQSAFELDPKLVVALKELSLVQLAQGKSETALRTISGAITKESSPDLIMARAEILAARKDYRAALRDCEAALRESDGNLEWSLMRAHLQRQLGLFQECLNDLRAAFSKTGSAVLHEECIDAMIDTGEHKAALKEIEAELADSRWRSSWLLRRARVRLALGETKSAHRDLRFALKELDERIVPSAPEVTLIIDRALAHALLNDHARARQDLTLARSLSPDASLLWRVEILIRPY